MSTYTGRFAVLDEEKEGESSVARSWPPSHRAAFPPKRNYIPEPVQDQLRLRKKFSYGYRVLDNGNVVNTNTLYIGTGVAHPYQVEALFAQAIQTAKNMPEVFGEDFECDVVVNLVRRNTGQYMGVAYVDVTCPAFYYALIGLNTDGSDRAEYYDDPSWEPPPESNSWADYVDCPKLRREPPPIIKLGEYEYDQEQKEHLETDETHGSLTVSPAFITSGWHETDPKTLFVQNVPSDDLKFLYAIFARYARTNVEDSEYDYYPKITIKETRSKQLVALVRYGHWHDAGFAYAMLRRVRALYKGKEVIMPVRFARLR